MSDDVNAADPAPEPGPAPPAGMEDLVRLQRRIVQLLEEQGEWGKRDQALQLQQADEARRLARSTTRFQLAGHPAAHPAGQGFAAQYLLFGALNRMINGLARAWARTRGIQVERPQGPTAGQTTRAALRLLLGLGGPLPFLLRLVLRPLLPSRHAAKQSQSTQIRPHHGRRDPGPPPPGAELAAIQRELGERVPEFTDRLREAVGRYGWREDLAAVAFMVARSTGAGNLPVWLQQQGGFPPLTEPLVEVRGPAVGG